MKRIFLVCLLLCCGVANCQQPVVAPGSPSTVELRLTVPVDSSQAEIAYQKSKSAGLQIQLLQKQIQDLQVLQAGNQAVVQSWIQKTVKLEHFSPEAAWEPESNKWYGLAKLSVGDVKEPETKPAAVESKPTTPAVAPAKK